MTNDNILDERVSFQGKKLRKGYTTGSSAAAAASAALLLLLEKEDVSQIELLLPRDAKIIVPIKKVVLDGDSAIATVIKDGGDDADATHGLEICAKVTLTNTAEIVIDGGIGVGRVTEEGLAQPVGSAAINPVPRQMIEKNLRQLLGEENGANVEIFVPQGAETAKLTMNSRLGILGGISILGTTGIVTPMSVESWKASISLELEMRYKQGVRHLIFVPGNYGEDFAINQLGFSKNQIVAFSNFVGYGLEEAQRIGFPKVLVIGHLGKLIKVAAGIFSTHSKDADARAEILVANLALMGMPQAQLEQIADCITTDAAGKLLTEWGYADVYQKLVDKIKLRCEKRLLRNLHQYEVEAIIFASVNQEKQFLASTQPLATLQEVWQ